MIPFTLSATGFLLLAYAIHHAHKRDRAVLVADIASANKKAADWQQIAADWQGLSNRADARRQIADEKVVALKGDLEWARVTIAVQALQIDRHFLMPTVAGMRAQAAASVAPVVPIRRVREFGGMPS
ncbi:hypothetical protein [Nocardioides sp. WS12]|uniref:hypothetical protein n=1 Tax=Nocardioides sp. WS12 TaxID=2486272 RepID=UPI0015F78E20|nr:hypothetical protein [Nocardioides sp. WS12]